MQLGLIYKNHILIWVLSFKANQPRSGLNSKILQAFLNIDGFSIHPL